MQGLGEGKMKDPFKEVLEALNTAIHEIMGFYSLSVGRQLFLDVLIKARNTLKYIEKAFDLG